MKVPGLNIDYSKNTFYYSFAFYSKNEEHLNKVVESFAEYYDNDILSYDHMNHKKDDTHYAILILRFDRYMETFFDVENRIQKSGMIDVQFDYRIMTIDDFIIFESNPYSKYLSKKHYIVAVFKGDNLSLFDTDIVNYYNEAKQCLIDKNIPEDVINKFNTAETFPDKNKVLDVYYNSNDIDERIYFAESDNHYIEGILIGRC